MINKISGVMPALVTPLNNDKINQEALKKLIGFLLKQKAKGFYIGGATGEGLLLSLDERKKLCEKSIDYIGGECTKIVHITDMNYKNTIELAKHAEACGADAISAIPPIYFSYDDEDIYNYYKNIAASVNIPVMIYYALSANRVMPTRLFKRLFEIDNITSVKWTNSNYYKVIELKSECPKASVINGPDEMLLCGLAAGADGGIGSTYNIMLPTYQKIYELYKKGEMKKALAEQTKADKVISVMLNHVVIPSVKLVLREMGIDVGEAASPQKQYSKEEQAAIIKELKDAGLEI